jgi:hypothetical protein
MAEQERRRIPSTLGGAVYIVVVLVSGIGLAVVAFGPWRRGIALIGMSLVLAALMRASLGDRDSGMLRVRRLRWVDVLMLAGAGAALLVLASVIPDQPS